MIATVSFLAGILIGAVLTFLVMHELVDEERSKNEADI